jgi:hypothetical protein
MGFFYSNDGKSFSTTYNYPCKVPLMIDGKVVNDTHSAMIIQKWWNNQKTRKRQNASVSTFTDDVDIRQGTFTDDVDIRQGIQNWWKQNRDSEYYYLFIDNSRFYIEELYNRLLTVVIPGIDYICVKKKDTFPKCILIKTNLHKSVLNNEIKEVLILIGYNYQFVLNKN